RKAPGVVAIYTGADLRADGIAHIAFPPIFKRAGGAPMTAPLRTPLAEGKCFYVGHPIAAVVAETRVQAQDAAERIAVEYEDLPCVVDVIAAIAPGAPQLWEDTPGNISAEARFGDAKAVEEAFKRAAHVTRVSLNNQRVIAMALEPRCSIAVFESGRWTLH